MKQITQDLWQSSRYSNGMLNTHAYLLQRGQGNVLFYNTNHADDLEEIAALGGIRFQLLTHRDETGASQQRIRDQFGCELGIGEKEVEFARQHGPVDHVFSHEDSALEDIQILHTPGHTNGSVCYLYHSPYGETYLFSGDTMFLWSGEWSTFVLEGAGGSNLTLAHSLEQLKHTSPDLVLSSGFVGDKAYGRISSRQWLILLGQLQDKLLRAA